MMLVMRPGHVFKQGLYCTFFVIVEGEDVNYSSYQDLDVRLSCHDEGTSN